MPAWGWPVDRAEQRTFMEITLADLMILEPRLCLSGGVDGAGGGEREPDEAPVSWAATVRTTVPHLPPLRGGELLLLPERAMAAVGDELEALIRESEARAVSGVVLPGARSRATYPGSVGLCVLHWDGALTSDIETDINRRLTECRGDLYRIGTELERRMADIAAAQAGLGPLARVVTETTDLGMAVVDAHDRLLVDSRSEASGSDAARSAAAADGTRLGAIERELTRGAALVLSPERPEQRIVARFLSERIAAAANAALQRDEAARPRGSQRAEAAARLLAGGAAASEQRSLALALGLDPDAVFFVAMSDVESASTVARALSSLGAAHPAGGRNGRRVTLVAAPPRMASETLAGMMREVTTRWEDEQGAARCSLALSGPAFGVASLPRAAREAEFVAAMQAAGDVPRLAASFTSAGDLGAMGLLYQLRDAPELRGFISEALGALPARDQRGTLRATLRAFLESGGSQVDASQRLGIHRNTLSYRLRRIGELVGRDVADPAAWLTLHLAIRASDMLDVVVEER